MEVKCRMAKEVRARQQAVQRGLVEDTQRLEELSSRVQAAQASAEESISGLFGGRKVQITGL